MDSEIRKIQLKCLEILDIVDGICKRHNIKYSLCGGSVVGAYLYNACLPWDDDVDLMMTRENYNRFIKVAKHELPTGFSIHNYQTGHDFQVPFTKIMNDRTTIVQHDGNVSGVFLDITVYDRIPQNAFASIDIFLWKVSQVVMFGKVKPANLRQRARNFMLSTVLRNKRAYLKLFQYVVELCAKTSRHYHYSELFGAFANTTRFAPEVFENYASVSFEGKDYMVVSDMYEYLHTRYNRTDFHEPKEKQTAPHYRYVDFNLPHNEYMAKQPVDGQ